MQFRSILFAAVLVGNWFIFLKACTPSPPVPSDNRGNPDCNFTTGICKWQNKMGIKLHWIAVSETAEYYSGFLPQQGSEAGYAWLDYGDWDNYIEKQQAKLVSPVITGPRCMTFYFHLHGNYTGFLNIETKVGTEDAKLIFSRYGDHGVTWQRAQVYINITGEYKVIITGTVGDHKARYAPGIDDISFRNQTCEKPPEEANFNCSMGNHRCGWQDEGSPYLMKAEYNQGLKRYVLKALGIGLKNFDKFYLRSPSVQFDKACVRFSYLAKSAVIKQGLSFLGRLLVFVVRLNDGEVFPFWSEEVYHGDEWRDVYVEIVMNSSEYKFVVEGLKISTDFLFRDFSLLSSYENCPTTVDKKLYMTSNPSQPEKWSISEHTGYCASFPIWYLIVSVVPTPNFPQAIYVYSIKGFLILNTTRNDTLYGDLLRYFYVSNDNRLLQSQAVYMVLQAQDAFTYVSKFVPSPIVNTTDYVFFVKEFVSIEDESKCEHGWTDLAGKCYKLFCGEKALYWNDARIDCLKNEADLASLPHGTLDVARQYLEEVQVRLVGKRTVSVGLRKIGTEWKWLNGETYNGNLTSSRIPNGRLAWIDGGNDWVLEAPEDPESHYAEEKSDLYFCEKIRENVAYRKFVNHSSDLARSESSALVDGDDQTCVIIEQKAHILWWQIDLGRETKIHRVKVIPSSKEKQTTAFNVSLILDENTPKTKRVLLADEAIDVLFEPPIVTRLIRLQTESGKRISLCEVEAYGTDNLDYLRGVLRSVALKRPEVTGLSSLQDNSNPPVPEFFHIMSSFSRPDLLSPVEPGQTAEDIYEQTLEAYYMTNVSGIYSFKTDGEDEARFILSSLREDLSSPIMKWDVSQTKSMSEGVYFEACVLYFVKATVEKLGDTGISLTALLRNTSFENTSFEGSLFWILPGELQVDLMFANRGQLVTTVDAPITITGVYETRCVGFYCGNCPLAVFMTFANYIQCTQLDDQTARNTGKVAIILFDWVLQPGQYDVKMAYRRNGDCTEIMKLTMPDVFSLSEVKIIGRITVKPVVVMTCSFDEEICDDSDVIYDGWNRVDIAQDFSDFGFESSPHNSTSSFSLGWIEKTAITTVTGICVTFRYKMSKSWNSELSLSTRTPASTEMKVWKLFGVHGDQWHTAWMHFSIGELPLKFVFKVSLSKVNETVLISNVEVTTESCPSKINPYFAQIDHSCTDNQFSCWNGECLKSSLRCDGESQCLDGSDESDCDCLLGEFSCVTGKKCVASSNICDGLNHCPDGSDERNCEFCPKEKFYCPDGKCVLWDSTCNDLWDCVDGSDEPNVCKRSKTGVTANKTCSLNNLGCLYEEQTNGSDCGYFQKCDFEIDWCGWSNTGLRDTFDWAVNQGATLSEDTGPEVDHTTTSSRGSYIYIESSPPRREGDTARLIGGPFKPRETVCLQFYYHMYGADVGYLAVYVASSRNRTVEEMLWKRNGKVDNFWHKALVNVHAENEFMIILEGGVGSSHRGDIAADDIHVLRGPCKEQYRDEEALTCSFEDVCSWKGLKTWKKSFRQDMDKSSFLEGSFMYTETPFSLTKTVSNHATIPYQCLSFWHQHTSSFCVNTTIYVSQQFPGYKWSTRVINTRQSNENWRFTEIPLQLASQDYTLSLKASNNEDALESCIVAIDELSLTPEPCSSVQEGKSVLARIKSRFYHGIQTKSNVEDTIDVFFKNPAPEFYQIYPKQNINQVLENTPVNISQLSPGARVLVETGTRSSVLGTVFGEYSNEWNNNDTMLVNLTIRLDENGNDIAVANKTIWLLPVQMADKGAIWRNPVKDCEEDNKFNNTCYALVNQSNWFDAVDQCKSLGGSLLTIDSLEEDVYITRNYPNMSFLWLYTLGRYSYGQVLLNSSSYVNATVNGTSERKIYEERKFHQKGSVLCPAFNEGDLVEVNCSTRYYGVCEIPAPQRYIMCRNSLKRTLECPDDENVLEIHSGIIGQDGQQLFQCEGFNVSEHQMPCTRFPDKTKETKLRCDGRRSCSLNNSMVATPCPRHRRYFDVVFSCNANRTKDVVENQPWCPYGYTFLESSCYKIPDKEMTWKDARNFCEADTSHLIRVNTRKEDTFLSLMMKSLNIAEVWIGLSDLAYEDVYQWSDGSMVGYTNWTDIDSYDVDPSFDCVVASGAGWMVKECGVQMKFVCEYEPAKGSCDFETDWCGWTNDPEQTNAGWIREFEYFNKSISSNISSEGLSFGNNISESRNYSSRLSLYHNKTDPGTFSSLLSPWIQSTAIDSHGVCLQFAFRLAGEQTELNVVIERKGMAKEFLWKVVGNQSLSWKEGRVSLGIVSHFRVRLTGKLLVNDSLINLASILFKSGLCQALPLESQAFDTHLSITTTGVLTSPYYPSFYLNNMSRRWHLRTLKGQRIRLKFLYLSLEVDPECKNDYVMIQNGGSISENNFYFCGKTLPPDFTSSSNQLQIVFKTNNKAAYTGFKIQYSIVKEDEEDGCLFADVLDCPENCRCYRWPSDQSKISVLGRGLFKIPSQHPLYTSTIFYEKSFFYKVTDSDFKKLPDLEFLSLNENFISVIEGGAFRKLGSLRTIRLAQNSITSVPSNVFSDNSSLEIIDLSGNWIQSFQPGQFSMHSNLRTLSLRFNKFAILEDGIFTGLENLRFLYLDENEISDIEDNIFNETTSLQILHLQHNKLRIIKKKWLQRTSSLKTLKLNHNDIRVIEAGSFDKLRELSELDLTDNKIEDFPEDLFTPLVSLRSLKVDHFTLCCYAEKALPSVSCSSIGGNGISSCDELLKNTVLKYSIWVLGVLAFLGNLGVVLWRVLGRDKNKVNSFLLTNLAISDFLMGVYMLIIAYKDTVWDGVYFKHDISWRASDLCIFAGVISTISSEVSVFTLSLITFDRVICIVFPFKFRRMSMKRAGFLTALIWVFGIALSVIPLLDDSYFYDFGRGTHFYGRSPVCLPFELSNEKSPGWEYSAFVFLGLNGTSFIFIVVAYVVMYRTIKKAGKAVRSTRVNQDSTLAKRMLFIILTDFFCWFPVIIISIMALTGSLDDPRKQVYAWIAVFVLPINSSINPILYTFSTPLMRGSGASKRATQSSAATMKSQGRHSEVAGGKTNSKSTTTTNASKRPMKPSVLHRHQMLNNAYVDDEVVTTPCTIPEKISEPGPGYENESKNIYDNVKTESRRSISDTEEPLDPIYEVINTDNDNVKRKTITSEDVYENVIFDDTEAVYDNVITRDGLEEKHGECARDTSSISGQDYVIANSLTKDCTHKTFILKYTEVVDVHIRESKIKTSFYAIHEIDGKESPCFVQVYDQAYIADWEATTTLMSSLMSEIGPNEVDYIVSYLWSARGSEVSLESDVDICREDCLICYDCPSNEMLEDVLGGNTPGLSAEFVYLCASDLIKAITILASKEIVHNAICTRNIFIGRDKKSIPRQIFLGGFSLATSQRFSSSKERGGGDNMSFLSKHRADITSYGEILKKLISECEAAENLAEIQEIILCCLSEDEDEIELSAKEILQRLEVMDINQIDLDV